MPPATAMQQDAATVKSSYRAGKVVVALAFKTSCAWVGAVAQRDQALAADDVCLDGRQVADADTRPVLNTSAAGSALETVG